MLLDELYIFDTVHSLENSLKLKKRLIMLNNIFCGINLVRRQNVKEFEIKISLNLSGTVVLLSYNVRDQLSRTVPEKGNR